MARCSRILLVIVAMVLLCQPTYAGMPAPYRLTDMGRMRIETISFFLAVLLSCAGLIQLLWNGLRKSFARLPRLNYARA